MLLKAGVDISRLERNTRRSLPKVQAVLSPMREELLITSTFEGNHGEGSLHYANRAYDIGLPRTSQTGIKDDIKTILGQDFDVVLESDHIHIEYDPPL